MWAGRRCWTERQPAWQQQGLGREADAFRPGARQRIRRATISPYSAAEREPYPLERRALDRLACVDEPRSVVGAERAVLGVEVERPPRGSTLAARSAGHGRHDASKQTPCTGLRWPRRPAIDSAEDCVGARDGVIPPRARATQSRQRGDLRHTGDALTGPPAGGRGQAGSKSRFATSESDHHCTDHLSKSICAWPSRRRRTRRAGLPAHRSSRCPTGCCAPLGCHGD